METLTIFIVEDDIMYSNIIEFHLSLNPDYQIQKFQTAEALLDKLHLKPSVITIDYSLPDMKGNQLLKKIKNIDSSIPVIVISGQEDISTAVALLKEGAYDYIVKNDDTKDHLWNTLRNLKEHLQLRKEVDVLRKEVYQKYTFENSIKGNSPALQKIFNLIDKASKTNINVSISGETGTGKELVAKAIHYNSERKNKAFVPVNMTAIPKELMESELFGYEKGAFTGALNRRIGKFEEADQGTIFLDEIGEMDLSMQSKLLRVIQEKEVTRLGGNNTVKIDVRIVVATHKNLADEVKKGNFREDLYYRLLGLPIPLPPLRERGNDIILLANYFLESFCKENKMIKLSFTTEAKEKLLKYPYPGNIRELKAITDLAAVMATSESVEEENINFSSLNSFSDFMIEETTLNEYTKRIIKHFLNKYDNNVLKVAAKLDIGKSTIYKMIKDHEIDI
ncbi:sigma-54-dependent transcriptional regulator [Cytophaga hutchinsonii]|uniref:Two-component response regulator n=1 Tax=Cytophaga hutchinsonii (strain ATCC 33406 / DSM 1761 / CIP 103989 / NBRC 15051 / NCIMB 9469 / D465) TaxID=269798 RepID=A0A6N4SV49_CYTH3|nr:sigma-54 dependent transcriptional regulator [Cytophaga hutchinsonii]ABG60127.1 two-component response regulator [Cytophaga hutchinsonii ATCC 33406]SFX23629.1 DNA-binding transcriptional response regulator, NtrC family, contains REC, AAA-type ATPase, and a Fis-type DNA-binding domains [Cytophaga hutchinsonii ATCC 33406]